MRWQLASVERMSTRRRRQPSPRPLLQQDAEPQHPPADEPRGRRRRAYGRDGEAPLAGQQGSDAAHLRQVHLMHAELFDELRGKGLASSPAISARTSRHQASTCSHCRPRTRLHLVGNRGGRGHRPAQSLRPDRRLSKKPDGRDPGQGRRRNLIRKAGIMSIVLADGDVRPGDAIRIELPGGPRKPFTTCLAEFTYFKGSIVRVACPCWSCVCVRPRGIELIEISRPTDHGIIDVDENVTGSRRLERCLVACRLRRPVRVRTSV